MMLILEKSIGYIWTLSALVKVAASVSFGHLVENILLPNTKIKKIGYSKFVNPYGFRFTLQSMPCTIEDKLIIVIHTATKPVYNERRMLMRSTWLNGKLLAGQIGMKVKIVFFMGLASDASGQRKIEYESELYGDIVQSDFVDNYDHNTYKAMSYLLWTSQNCAKASLLMKIDDDTLPKWGRMASLVPIMERWISIKGPVYAGSMIKGRHSRYVSKEVWPYESSPTWFQGLAYFLTPQHTEQLFHTALNTRYMSADDVFVGIVVHKTPAVYLGTVELPWILAYAEEEAIVVKSLVPEWTKVNRKTIFFHMPELKSYYEWIVIDLEKPVRVKEEAVRWFQW